MPWTSKFPVVVPLDDGRTLVTLADARDIMLALPDRHQQQVHWQHPVELLLIAAQGRPNRNKIEAATDALFRALQAEGLILRKRASQNRR